MSYTDNRGMIWEGVPGYSDRIRVTTPNPFGHHVDPLLQVTTAGLFYSQVIGLGKIFLTQETGAVIRCSPGTVSNSLPGTFTAVSMSLRGVLIIARTAPSAELDAMKRVPRLMLPEGVRYFFAAEESGFDVDVPGVGHVLTRSNTEWVEDTSLIALPPSPGAGTWAQPPSQFIASVPVAIMLLIRQARAT